MNQYPYKRINKVLWFILAANLLVAAIKIAIGYMINSTSLTADGFHSLTDGSSNVVGLLGIHFASKPIDEQHPYGHSKFETLSGLFIAFMLIFLAIKIISNAALRAIYPATPSISLFSLISLVVTLLINIFIAKFEYAQGKKLNSTILISDSFHTKSDIFVSIGVLLTLAAVKLGAPPILDAFTSLAVSMFVLHAAYEIILETGGVLVDQAVVSPQEVKDVILTFPQVRNVHKIRSRGCNQSIYIDLHILLEPHMSVESSHRLMHDIEEQLCLQLKKHVQTYIHVEPYYEQNPVSGI